MYPMTCAHYWDGKGESWLKLLSPHCRRPSKTCSEVIRIVFSLLMSPSSGGLSRPPAVRWKVARTPWGRGLIEFTDWRYSQSCWYFLPGLWTITPLTFSLVNSPTPPLPLPLWISILYARIRGGGMGSQEGGGLRQIKHLPQSPFTIYRSIILDNDMWNCFLSI